MRTSEQVINTSDYRVGGAVFTHTPDRFCLYAQQSRRQKSLDALSGVLDRPLPVLGRTTSTHRLELVRRQPRSVEQHTSIARSLFAGRPSSEVHDSRVFSARYCDVAVRSERRRLCRQPDTPLTVFNQSFKPGFHYPS